MASNEHGWNDPPRISYQELTNKKVSSLTKRPTYPSSSSTIVQPITSQQPNHPLIIGNAKLHTSPVNLPPPPVSGTAPCTNTSLLTAPIDDQKSDNIVVLLDSSEIMEYMNGLLIEKNKVINEKQSIEIAKRLNLLSKQWENGKVSNGVHLKLSELVTAIRTGECNKKEAILTALMVDHVTEVSQWLVGVKRLVNS